MSELATSVGVALVVTLLALWAAGPAAACVMAAEPHVRLNLGRIVDREHLATDVRTIARIARRGTSDGAAEKCEGELNGQLMTAHDVTAAEIRSAAARER
jgi:hypothetical protein